MIPDSKVHVANMGSTLVKAQYLQYSFDKIISLQCV